LRKKQVPFIAAIKAPPGSRYVMLVGLATQRVIQYTDLVDHTGHFVTQHADDDALKQCDV